MSGHNDEVTRRHWREELANCLYQMTDGEIVIFLRENPVAGERLRAAREEADEIEVYETQGESSELVAKEVERTINKRGPRLPNPARPKNPRGRPAKGSRLDSISKSKFFRSASY